MLLCLRPKRKCISLKIGFGINLTKKRQEVLLREGQQGKCRGKMRIFWTLSGCSDLGYTETSLILLFKEIFKWGETRVLCWLTFATVTVCRAWLSSKKSQSSKNHQQKKVKICVNLFNLMELCKLHKWRTTATVRIDWSYVQIKGEMALNEAFLELALELCFGRMVRD